MNNNLKKSFKSIGNYKYLESVLDLKNKRTVELTYLSLTIVALIFFGVFAINPTLSTIAKLQKELSDNQFVENQLQKKITSLSSLQTAYNALQSDLPIINSSIPKNPQAPLLLGQVQSVAKSSGVSIISDQIFPIELENKTAPTKKQGSFIFSILMEGSEDKLGLFINGISNMRRVISIDQITYTKKADDSETFQLSIKGTAFFQQ